MKTILCYGDSNTWGYDPTTEERYPLEARWTSVLARELGPDYLVIPEGLNGRTTVWPDPVGGRAQKRQDVPDPLPGIALPDRPGGDDAGHQ